MKRACARTAGTPDFGWTRSYLPVDASSQLLAVSEAWSWRISSSRARSVGSSMGMRASTRRWKFRGIQSALEM
jgi:hypothetical protein